MWLFGTLIGNNVCNYLLSEVYSWVLFNVPTSTLTQYTLCTWVHVNYNVILLCMFIYCIITLYDNGASIDKTRNKLETTRQMNLRSLFNPNQSINYFYYTIRQLPEVILASACFHWPGLTCWFHKLLIGRYPMNPLAVRGGGSEWIAAESRVQHRLFAVALTRDSEWWSTSRWQ